jgi:Fe-Mn family superoxide dismutase
MSVDSTSSTAAVWPYKLPPLRHGYDHYEPAVEAATMRLHHDAHHRGYVDKLNAVLEPYPAWHGLTVEALLRRIDEVPEAIRATIRNQGGGHANHQFFWKILGRDGAKAPSADLAAAIDHAFGSFEQFKMQFEAAGVAHFGSGWAFLVARPQRNFALEILTLPNQESVLTLPEPAPGLLICDLWEHAYYLSYQNRRAAWLHAFWDIVDWDVVDDRFDGIRAGRMQL